MLALKHYGSHNNKRPLVMVHGFLCSGLFFETNIKALQHHYHFITVDLPGFGGSNAVPSVNSIAKMSEQVLTTLSHAGIEQFHLLGHSMGGMVALQTALTASKRVQSLIIYASNSSGDLPERFETFDESKQRLQQNFSESKQRICATWFIKGKQHPHFKVLEQCAAPVTLSTAENAIDAMATFNVTNQLNQIIHPTLIISAEHDKTYSLNRQQQLQKNIVQAQWQLMPNCAHCAHLENEVLFNKIISDWLDKNN